MKVFQEMMTINKVFQLALNSSSLNPLVIEVHQILWKYERKRNRLCLLHLTKSERHRIVVVSLTRSLFSFNFSENRIKR